MQTECGYTPAEARNCTLQDYLDLADHWSRHPPPGLMLRVLASAWGWKPPEIAAPQIDFDEAIAAQGDTFNNLDRWFKA